MQRRRICRLSDLNDRYGKKFGHPFIIAVRGLDRATILAAFGKRVAQSVETEFATALGEVHKIAQASARAIIGRITTSPPADMISPQKSPAIKAGPCIYSRRFIWFRCLSES
jgi:hypothetical protein